MIVNDLEIFKEYVSSYDLNDINIERKFYHSIRVRNNAKEIAESLNLTNDDVSLASFIGLTHDIGRFLQWKVYGTFADTKSIDHALLSVQVLFGKDYKCGFNISDVDANVIRVAIYNHNKYKVQDDVTKRELLFANIVRDADKVDLLYLLGEEDIPINEDGSEVTSVIHDAFMRHEPIKITECKTNTDRVLVKFAFVFDLNFVKSFEIVDREKLLDKFYDNLKYKDKYKKYYLYAKEFIEKRKNADSSYKMFIE